MEEEEATEASELRITPSLLVYWPDAYGMSQFISLETLLEGMRPMAEEWLESHSHIGEMSGSLGWRTLSFPVLAFHGWF